MRNARFSEKLCPIISVGLLRAHHKLYHCLSVAVKYGFALTLHFRAYFRQALRYRQRISTRSYIVIDASSQANTLRQIILSFIKSSAKAGLSHLRHAYVSIASYGITNFERTVDLYGELKLFGIAASGNHYIPEHKLSPPIGICFTNTLHLALKPIIASIDFRGSVHIG